MTEQGTETADTEKILGEITDETPVGTVFVMEDGEEWELTANGADLEFLAAGVPARFKPDEWNESYACCVEEARYPEPQDAEGEAASGEEAPQAVDTGDPGALLAKIREQNELVLKARRMWLAAKEDAAETKKIYDKCVVHLTDMIAETPPETPLFDQAEQKDEAWRDMVIAHLDLPERIAKALADHTPPIITLGDLIDWQKEKGDFWAKDIKGIGGASAAKITLAMDHYWAQQKALET